MNRLDAALLLLVVIDAGHSVTACEALNVDRAWVRQPPPVSHHAAAYLRLENTGNARIRVLGVSSPQFDSATLHQTVYEDDTARMRHLDTIELTARARFVLEPGGAHIMLTGAHGALDGGGIVELELVCDIGDPLMLTLPVSKQAPQTN